MQIDQLSPGQNFVVLVRGLRKDDLYNRSVCKMLYDLWINWGLVVFRECEVNTELQVALSKCFGNLEQHPHKEIWVEGHPELVRIKYDPASEILYEVNGVPLGGWVPWHSDLVYMPRINHGGI